MVTGSSLLQRVLEADAAEDAFDDDDYEVDTPKRRHRGKGRVSGGSVGVISRLSQRTEVRLLNSRGSCGRSRARVGACSADSHSVWLLFLRVEVQAAGGRMQTTTSHISVTVSRD